MSDDLRLKDYESLMLHLEDLRILKNTRRPVPYFCQILFTELMKEIIHYLPDDQQPDLNKVAEKICGSTNIVELMDMTYDLAGRLAARLRGARNLPEIG